MMIFVFALIATISSKESEILEKILLLKNNVKEEHASIVTTVLAKYNKNGEIDDRDVDFLVAMTFIESSFENIHGSHGEVGMLQVIPEDAHIRDIFCKLYTRCSEVRGGKALRQFLFDNEEIAFEVGVNEYLFWKEQYNTKLKKMYWSKHPVWLLKNESSFVIAQNKKDWEIAKKIFGDNVFVLHYNWGGKYLISDGAWSYFRKLSSVLSRLNNYN